jgi:hypothetical protein
MFSPALKLAVLPQQQWDKFGLGCWHSTTPHTTTATNHLQPRKRVQTKLKPSIPLTPITTNMTPTSQSATPGTTAPSKYGSVIDLILNEDKADDFIAKIQAKPAFPIFAPPGPCPSCTGDCYRKGDTKTQKRANKAAAKKDKAELKAKQKHAVASHKANSQLKKCEKLKAHAQKVAARAEALPIHLETSTPSMKGSSAHALKKSKGSEGHTAVTSPSSLMAHLRSQWLSAVVKKRMMLNSPRCSEGLSSSSGSRPISGSSDDSNAASSISGAPLLC